MASHSQDLDGVSPPFPGNYALKQLQSGGVEITAQFQSNGVVSGTDGAGVSYVGAWQQRAEPNIGAYLVAFALTSQAQGGVTAMYLGDGGDGVLGGPYSDSAGDSGAWTMTASPS